MMEDKEAQEKIENKLAELYCGHGAWIHKGIDGQKILALLGELGYRKLPKDKPPLVDNPYGGDVHLDAGVYDGLYHKVFEESRQAQREADIKHYEGGQ